MDNLRDRFATLDRVPVPDVWSDVARRLEALGTTSRLAAPTSRLAAPTPAWRGSGDGMGSLRTGGPASRGYNVPLLACAVLTTLLLVGVAVAVGTGLVRLPAVVPPPASSRPSPSEAPTPNATEATSSPLPAGPLGGGLILVHDLPQIVDHSVHDVVALDAGTGARTQLGTLPSTDAYQYVFQRNTDRNHVLVLTNNSLGAVSNLQAPTDASLPFGFIAKRNIDYGSGLVLSPRGDLIAGVDNFDRPTRMVISGVERGSQRIPLPSGVRRLLVLGWSPDQSALLAMGCRPCNTTQTPQERQTPDHGHVYIVPLDGSPWRELLDEDNGYFLASWSPDGSTLAVTDFTCGGKTTGPRCAPGGKSTTALVAVADGTARTLTSATERSEMAAWSPDSRQIAFVGGKVGDVLGDGGIYVMNADGTGALKLADTTADEPPIWSPDGRWLMFRKDWGTTEWWIVPAAGGQPRSIGNYGPGAW
jgi:WD40-like Beta Propeller Repeat